MDVVVHQAGRKPPNQAVGGAELCGWWIFVPHGPEAAVPRDPEAQKSTKNVLKNRQRTCVYLFMRDDTWAGPWPGPSNPQAGPRKWGRPAQSIACAWGGSLSMSWAGPGRHI